MSNYRSDGKFVALMFSFAALIALGFTACVDDGNGGGNGKQTLSGKFCQPECSQASDCGTGMNPDKWECKNGVCRGKGDSSDNSCSKDEQCWATFSGWKEKDCKSSGCSTGQACVSIGSKTYCALEEQMTAGCVLGMPLEADKADGSGKVTVCANQSAECKDGVCHDPCESDMECPGDLVCDTNNGECKCEDDSHCSGDMVCDGGSCVCKTDEHCPGTNGQDKCYDGFCGCANEDSCQMGFTCADISG